MSLVTPAKIRTLQRKLYRKAITTPLAARSLRRDQDRYRRAAERRTGKHQGGFKKIR
jgi:hypothetical protein